MEAIKRESWEVPFRRLVRRPKEFQVPARWQLVPRPYEVDVAEELSSANGAMEEQAHQPPWEAVVAVVVRRAKVSVVPGDSSARFALFEGVLRADCGA